MDERVVDALFGQRFEISTGFTEIDPLTDRLADPESFLNQMIER